jgi:hypothetical protein
MRGVDVKAKLPELTTAFKFLEKAYQEKSLDISWYLKADLPTTTSAPTPAIKPC